MRLTPLAAQMLLITMFALSVLFGLLNAALLCLVDYSRRLSGFRETLGMVWGFVYAIWTAFLLWGK